MTIKEELQNVKEAWEILYEYHQRRMFVTAINREIIKNGEKSLVRLEELIDDLDPEGIK